VVEQLICNQQAGGSNPFASSTGKMSQLQGFIYYFIGGEVAERSKAADCKSAGASLRRFKSCPPQRTYKENKAYWMFIAVNKLKAACNAHKAGVAQLARASAFQAEGRGFESRLPLIAFFAHVAQSVEHILGKDEVSGSSPLVGSMLCMTTCSLIY
jgi:hypothetical protein